MANKLVLNLDDLIDLTGYSRPSAQMRWLSDNRICFLVGGDGLPKVLFEVIRERFESTHTNTVQRKRQPEIRL